MKQHRKHNLSIYGAFLFMVLTVLSACDSKTDNKGSEGDKKTYQLEVHNPLDIARSNVMVRVSLEELFVMNLQSDKAFIVKQNGKEIPSQYVDNKGLVLVLDELGPKETQSLALSVVNQDEIGNYPKRTQAELSIKKGGEWKEREYIGGQFENIDSLRVPDEHTDHSWYVRYEGPGWESDLVGYRFYLDWRNATDVFGKTSHDMVLQQVGQDGFDSYHELSDWGMDVLKVGKSLGVGSIGSFQDNKAMRVAETDSVISKVAENGAVYSAIETDYFGWKIAGQDIDLKSVISIHAGTRLSKQHLTLEKALDNMCTGLHKEENTNLFTSQGDADHWGYIATYGVQSLNNDNLGLAVLFAPDRFVNFTEDENSHIVTLKQQDRSLDYYFLATWEKEPNGIKTEEEFIDYLKKTASELAHPVQVTVEK